MGVGGVIYVNNANNKLNNIIGFDRAVHFYNNTAMNQAGGTLNIHNGKIIIQKSVVSYSGGGISLYESSFELSDNALE